MRRVVGFAVAAVLVVLSVHSAVAHTKDVVSTTRVGPIRNKTKIGQVKRWLGSPDFVTTFTIFDCKLKISSWGIDPNSPKFAVVRRNGSGKVRSATAARKKITAGSKGTLKPHTGKGLRIGNPVAKLRELYPDATSTDVENGKQWTLVSASKGTVQARTSGGKVRTLVGTSSNICPG